MDSMTQTTEQTQDVSAQLLIKKIHGCLDRAGEALGHDRFDVAEYYHQRAIVYGTLIARIEFDQSHALSREFYALHSRNAQTPPSASSDDAKSTALLTALVAEISAAFCRNLPVFDNAPRSFYGAYRHAEAHIERLAETEPRFSEEETPAAPLVGSRFRQNQQAQEMATLFAKASIEAANLQSDKVKLVKALQDVLQVDRIGEWTDAHTEAERVLAKVR